MSEPVPPLPRGRGSAALVEITFSAVLVFFSGFFIWQATLVNQPPTTLVVGPRTFPIIVGVLTLVMSVIVLSRGLWNAYGREGAPVTHDTSAVPLEEDETTISDWLAVWSVLGSLLAFFIFLKPLGFILATTLFLFALSSLFAPRRWLRNLIVATTFSTFFFFLFAWLLGIPLPKGLFAPFLTTMVG
jgi:putative tricarboxylic transport membrane protein